MVSEVDIANRALQKLGAEKIVSLTEDSQEAREVNRAYAVLRDAELRAHPWNFAKTRVVLAPTTNTPAFGWTYEYNLPSDCLIPIRQNDDPNWQVEGRTILTDQGTTLDLTYIKRETDTSKFDPLFVELLAARIAVELAEQFTQSNTKKDFAAADYKRALREARRMNAFENPAQQPPESRYVAARR